jgi:hypothetical protein
VYLQSSILIMDGEDMIKSGISDFWMLCLASIGNEWIVQKQVAPIRSFYQFPNTTNTPKCGSWPPSFFQEK